MNLSISNIAWNVEEDNAIRLLLSGLGIQGIEIAPTKIWERPLDYTILEAEKVKTDWASKGIRLVAMQSLLFGQSHLNLFSSDESRREMITYLSGIIDLASKLGISSLVFGSPKNRIAGSLSKREQYDIAVPFFYVLGTLAAKENVTICLEPNPIQYGCDFITNSDDGIELVREVGHPGFRLHLDAGALCLNDEDIPAAIEKSMPYLNHFHISEPYLNLIGTESTPHIEIANTLNMVGYQNWVSIEMKNNLSNNNVEAVEKALLYAMEIYS
ncbi:sugar phosphate isomerase/epimerase [Paenibacillus anaericanus]|uniref:Sugar phosphate isomerase/epimerase n=1 Tax=Paenibacillus anaericanus TaxID=170367 RepID=A0A433Y3T5_9BACL|nr:sugar phosphate isomerase/epimerase family protein [Paenibacillus anaericanus]RUT42882.1 sugar phosphate isomerase/epimerase [Paenibacillus anaericanus]